MEDVRLPIQTCLKMLKMPRAAIIRIIIDTIMDTIQLKDSDEGDTEDEDTESHLDSPEADKIPDGQKKDG